MLAVKYLWQKVLKRQLLLPYIAIGAGLGPAICIFFQLKFDLPYGWWFVGFMTVHALIRTWETFFTSKDQGRLKVTGDWTLTLTTIVYTSFCFCIVFEFFFLKRIPSVTISLIGLVFYGLAFRLRWWAMRALGSQWSIHAVGMKRVKKVRLLYLGPYKYVRHPIYASVLLDQLAVLLVANAFYSSLYYLFISWPAYCARIAFEEKNNMEKFGDKYATYRKKVGMLVPRFLATV